MMSYVLPAGREIDMEALKNAVPGGIVMMRDPTVVKPLVPTKDVIRGWYNKNGFYDAAEKVDDILAEHNNDPRKLANLIMSNKAKLRFYPTHLKRSPKVVLAQARKKAKTRERSNGP